MNKTAIKNFAVWARTKLRSDIKIRAGFLGINEDGIATPLPASTSEIKYFQVGSAQPVALSGANLWNRDRIVEALEKRAKESDYKTAYDHMVETYASDWFNRFIALRFMEVNERFSDNMRILSSSNSNRQDPDIVSIPFSSDIEFTEEEKGQISEWKAKNETDRLFRFLLIKRCNELHAVLPGLFEKEGDPSELMMYQSFIDKDGLIYHLVHDIDEEDWKDQVQIIGWIYQYYNSELKDETFALTKKGKKITKDRIPSATQLFTPDWIVRYMVENSLGRLWVEGHTSGEWTEETEKKAADCFGWKYYLTEAKQEPEVAEQLAGIRTEYGKLNPEDLTFIDPSMGSGHILVYAFDVLMQIYESVGYTQRDAARSIVEHNLYGLDIDDRAYQLAYFAVMMKACQYDGRFLTRGVKPHVYAIQESNDINRNQLQYFGAGLNEFEKTNALNQVTGLLDTFLDAKEYGSILNVENYDWNLLKTFSASYEESKQISMDTFGIENTQEKLQPLVKIGEVMAKKYRVACTNPPYMAVTNGNDKLQNYIKEYYPNEKADLFAVFMERCALFTYENGLVSMITMQSWMYLQSFEKFREEIEHRYEICNLLRIGYNSFPELNSQVAHACSFVMRVINIENFYGKYLDLNTGKVNEDKEKVFFSRRENQQIYLRKANDFERIPGKPLAFLLDRDFIKIFSGEKISDVATVITGMTTGNNNQFLKLWFEINNMHVSLNSNNIDHAVSLGKYWFPYSKGGERRNWYGNTDYVVNWSEKDKFNRSKTTLKHLYLQEALTWPFINTDKFCARILPQGYLWDVAGSPCFFENKKIEKYVLGFLCSNVARMILAVINPTINIQAVDIEKLPIVIIDKKVDEVDSIVENSIDVAKNDWDSFETSWDFSRHPVVQSAYEKKAQESSQFAESRMEKFSLISWHFERWQEACEKRFNTLKENEEELNRIFMDIYGLQDELSPEEEDSDVTVRKADLGRDIRSLISYAVGCMFGRYSLDVDGLTYAGGEWDDSKYTTFQPDADNVIPITDARYMKDDIVDRFCDWLTAAYGAETLEENLDFIAKALGTKGTDSRDIIRKYFLNDFFKDHCQTYSVTGSGKRPIYWLFDSGKQNGFKALVYMHRYNADTIGRVRVSYLHPLQEKYENEVRSIDTMLAAMKDQRQIAAEERRKEKLAKQIAEVKEYDEKLDHLAQERIEIDLDDGVKVNYEKIQTDREGKKYQILAPIK